MTAISILLLKSFDPFVDILNINFYFLLLFIDSFLFHWKMCEVIDFIVSYTVSFISLFGYFRSYDLSKIGVNIC